MLEKFQNFKYGVKNRRRDGIESLSDWNDVIQTRL
jgi:hypothetical protein